MFFIGNLSFFGQICRQVIELVGRFSLRVLTFWLG